MKAQVRNAEVAVDEFQALVAALRVQGVADPGALYRRIKRGWLAMFDGRADDVMVATAARETLRRIAAPGGVARAFRQLPASVTRRGLAT